MRFIKLYANSLFILFFGILFFISKGLIIIFVRYLLGIDYVFENKYSTQVILSIIFILCSLQILFFFNKNLFYFKKKYSKYLALTLLLIPLFYEFGYVFYNLIGVPFCYSYNIERNPTIILELTLRIIAIVISLLIFYKLRVNFNKDDYKVTIIGFILLFIVLNLETLIMFLKN